MRLSKDEFINGVNALGRMYAEEQRINQALGINEWTGATWIDEYYYLFSSLCELTEDVYAGTDLDYYIYDLQFGKNWHPGMFMVNGKDIPLRNAEELWNWLNCTPEDIDNKY